MQKRKGVIVLISFCLTLALSGCKRYSIESKNEYSLQQSYTQSEHITDNFTTKAEPNKPISSDEDKHITRTIKTKCVIEPSETRVIEFDLNVPEVPLLTAYNYNFLVGGNYDIRDIIGVFFGNDAKNFTQFENSEEQIFHNSADINDYSLAEFNKDTGKLCIVKGDAAAMDYTSENMLQCANEMKIDITEHEAIELCDTFLNDCGITGYTYDYTLYYGATQSTYYLIRYYYELDSLPASSHISDGKGFCNLSFFVSNDGLVKITGYLFDDSSFDRTETIGAEQIISPKEAIDCIAEQAAVLRCGNENPQFNKYFSNRGEGLLYLPVREMKLGYWYSESDGIKLAWIFYIEEDNAIEKSGSFAIDAVSGKVYNI